MRPEGGAPLQEGSPLFIEFSHAFSLDLGRGRASDAATLELSEEHIRELVADTETAEGERTPVGFTRNPDPEDED